MKAEHKPTERSRDFPSLLRNVRRWSTGWTVTIIVIPIMLIALSPVANNYWNRPQLSIAVAKALVGAHRVVALDGVHEYRAVLDMKAPCVAWLSEHSAASEDILPAPIEPVRPRLVYGVYLENTGRSELTEIRLSFRSHVGAFAITGSPQLSLTETQQSDPNGDVIRTVTIAAMAPRSKGVIFASLTVSDGYVSVESTAADRFQINYRIGEEGQTPTTQNHFRFSGAAQLSDTAVTSISVNDLFIRQKEAFGLDAVHLPIEPVEFSAQGGSMNMRVINAPFMGCTQCPTVAPGESYSVPIP